MDPPHCSKNAGENKFVVKCGELTVLYVLNQLFPLSANIVKLREMDSVGENSSHSMDWQEQIENPSQSTNLQNQQGAQTSEVGAQIGSPSQPYENLEQSSMSPRRDHGFFGDTDSAPSGDSMDWQEQIEDSSQSTNLQNQQGAQIPEGNAEIDSPTQSSLQCAVTPQSSSHGFLGDAESDISMETEDSLENPENLAPEDIPSTSNGPPFSMSPEKLIRKNKGFFRRLGIKRIDKNDIRVRRCKKEKPDFGNCNCSEGNCLSTGCWNYALRVECGFSCRVSICRNKRITKGSTFRLEIFLTDKKGYGLRTLDEIPIGSFVIEYLGELRPNDQLSNRKKNNKKRGVQGHYFLSVDECFIDAAFKGNEARFINHDCAPNLLCQKWKVPNSPRDFPRIAFFAKRMIQPGEELSFNYQFDKNGEQHPCHCNAEGCTKVIGGVIEKDDRCLDNLEEKKNNPKGSSSSTSPSSIAEQPSFSKRGRILNPPNRYC